MSAFGRPEALAIQWQVDLESHGLRADYFLISKIGRLSRTRAQKIITSGDFRRNGEELKPASKVFSGDALELWRLPPCEESLDFESVRTLFEDDDWLVVNKPAGLAVHPTAKYLNHTLTAWLRKYAPATRIHPCHRLDRETSGVLVCSKHKKAESFLKTAFQNGCVSKTYLAIVQGELKEKIRIEAPLALQGDRGIVRIRMVVDQKLGLPSLTEVVPLRYCEEKNRTLVECHPKTGRQHQIRAHLAYVGHPIVADKLYAMGEVFFDSYTKFELGTQIDELEHRRQALHASEISFEYEGKRHRFSAEFPDELNELLCDTHRFAVSN